MPKRKQKIKNKPAHRECNLYIEGMHCSSCEILIEKKLLKKNFVHTADATLKHNKVELTIDQGHKLDTAQLNAEFADLGYSFSNKKIKRKDFPLISFDNKGQLKVNPKKLTNILKTLMVTSGLIIAFFVFEELKLGQYVSVDANSSLLAFLLLGFVAGISSCAALIGGLLLSMTKQWNELYIDAENSKQKFQPHLLFHIGRLLSFFVFGGLLGLLGDTISLNNATVYAAITIGISLVMLILSLQMLGIEWAQNFRFTAPKSLTRAAADETKFQGRYMPFAIGALTFLLPCGFTLIAQGIALTTGSFLQGGLVMLLFSLGTFPMLLGISISGVKLNSKPHLTARFNVIAGLVIVFFVVYNVNGQLNVLGLPSLSDISFAVTLPEPQQAVGVNEQGEQIITMTAEGFSYIPTSSLTIKSGFPTKLIVEDKGILGCGAFMASRGLINNYVALRRGQNVIDLGTPDPGTYKVTCSMGMVAPVTITVI